jgi:hypothetical protein
MNRSIIFIISLLISLVIANSIEKNDNYYAGLLSGDDDDSDAYYDGYFDSGLIKKRDQNNLLEIGKTYYSRKRLKTIRNMCKSHGCLDKELRMTKCKKYCN